MKKHIFYSSLTHKISRFFNFSTLYIANPLVFCYYFITYFSFKGAIILISSLLIPKESLKTITAERTLKEALAIMEDNKLRCIPILDQSNLLYRGNIYRYHIYQHIANGHSLDKPVTHLLKNANKFILNTDSFFTLFFKLNDLPYVSVLNEKHHFLGVIHHKDVMAMLSQSWCATHSSFVLTVEVPEDSKSFLNILKLLKKHTNLNGIITLDREEFSLRKRMLVSLPATFTQEALDKLLLTLQKKGVHILDIEDLRNGL